MWGIRERNERMTFAGQAKKVIRVLVGVILAMFLNSTDMTAQAAFLYETGSQENVQAEDELEMVEIEEEKVPLEVPAACTAHWGVLALLGCYIVAGVMGILKKSDMRFNVIACAVFAVALVISGFFWECKLDLYVTVVAAVVVVAFNVLDFVVNRQLFSDGK